MRDWKVTLQVGRSSALLLVTEETSDVLKARLPLSPSHPRALLTLLEGLSLWCGEPLHVAVSASDRSVHWGASGLFGGELYPGESQLVQFHVGPRACRVQRLRGVADFRSVRRRGA